ncbi:MAG: DUF5360 family protein [Actinomycetes bacterium]
MALVADADRLLRITAWLMLVTDVGFVLYWTLIAIRLLPAEVMFADYDQPTVAAWNWSFLPLDMAASISGFAAVRALRRGHPRATPLLATSLTLTSTAGGMALAYWAIRGDFELTWWLPNAFLLVFPLGILVRLFRSGSCFARVDNRLRLTSSGSSA